MSQQRKEGLSSRLPARPDTPPFMVLVENESGQYEIATVTMEEGVAPLWFLSPIDAHIEGLLRSKPGRYVGLISTGGLPADCFLRSSGVRVAILHMAWSFHRGRLLLGNDGLPNRFCGAVVQRVIQEAAPVFEIGTSALASLDALYEQAGLFAWRETYKVTDGWDAARLRREAEEALRKANPIQFYPVIGQSEAGLYDPEFGSWHAVPRAFAVDQQINDDD